jgi:hypothetical protein
MNCNQKNVPLIAVIVIFALVVAGLGDAVSATTIATVCGAITGQCQQYCRRNKGLR